MNILEVKNLNMSYKTIDGEVEAVKDVSFTVKEGESFGIVGESGCGKSTLLRMIAGLEDLTSGEIEIDGEKVSEVPPSKRGLAMVFQSYALYPHMSVRKNIGFPLQVLCGLGPGP